MTARAAQFGGLALAAAVDGAHALGDHQAADDAEHA